MRGETGKKVLFEIQTLDWIANNRPEQWKSPRRSDRIEITWIKKGTGTYLIDLEKHEIGEDKVYCTDVGQLHFLQPNEGAEGYQIAFCPQFLYLSGEDAGPLFEKKDYSRSGMARVIQIDGQLRQEMEDIMLKMTKEFTGSSFLGSEILKGWLKILVVYLTRIMEMNKSEAPESRKQEIFAGRNTELVRKFMVLLENNLTRKKMVGDYASDLGISANYLNEIVKRVTGCPAYFHIQQRKILEAKRQAICQDKSMKEIAYYLGFDDASHFSKFFKVKTGLNFTEFKKRIQASQYL